MISNAKWVAVSQFVRILSQLANLFVLARLLPPSDYGLMAMATVVTNLALLLRDQGTSAALIQKEKLSDQTITTVFWFNIALGLLIATLILVFSPLIAAYFKEPALIGVLCALALVFPLASSATSHQALLERASEFKKLALIEVTASIVAMVVAIIAAVKGLGVYSLVLQAVLMTTLSSIFIWVNSQWRPKGRPSFNELKTILPFTSHMTGFQLIIYFSRNADSVVIGRLIGTASLGIYSMAYKVMLLPVQNITWAVSRALYPLMSRQQSTLNEMGKLYLQTVSFISLVTAPLMVGVFVLREPLVHVAFGHQWHQVANVLIWLAPIGYLQSVSSTIGAVFMAQGKTKLLMLITLFSTIVQVTAFILGAKWGVEGVAAAYLIASMVTVLPAFLIATKLVKRNLLNLIQSIWHSVVLALLMGLVVRFCYLRFSGVIEGQLLEFFLLISIGVLVYLLLAFIFIKKQILLVFQSLRGR